MRVFVVLFSLIAFVATACTGGGATEASVASAVSSSTTSSVAASTAEEASDRTPAPEFPDNLDWLNVDGPLDLASLRGKIVLLDFWTYGCINCIHIIPDLKRLEAEFPDELVVIGVHSAKFDNEGNTDNIREITQRYDLRHPVVNDADFEIWNSWGARAWPTVALVDPEGNAVGIHAGEGVYQVVQPVISDPPRGVQRRRPDRPDADLRWLSNGTAHPPPSSPTPGRSTPTHPQIVCSSPTRATIGSLPQPTTER